MFVQFATECACRLAHCKAGLTAQRCAVHPVISRTSLHLHCPQQKPPLQMFCPIESVVVGHGSLPETLMMRMLLLLLSSLQPNVWLFQGKSSCTVKPPSPAGLANVADLASIMPAGSLHSLVALHQIAGLPAFSSMLCSMVSNTMLWFMDMHTEYPLYPVSWPTSMDRDCGDCMSSAKNG